MLACSTTWRLYSAAAGWPPHPQKREIQITPARADPRRAWTHLGAVSVRRRLAWIIRGNFADVWRSRGRWIGRRPSLWLARSHDRWPPRGDRVAKCCERSIPPPPAPSTHPPRPRVNVTASRRGDHPFPSFRRCAGPPRGRGRARPQGARERGGR